MFKENIDNSIKDFRDELEILDLEPDWENYISRHSGYIEEWEAYQHYAEDQITNVFDSYEKNILNLIISEDIETAIASLIALQKACEVAEINDEYEISVSKASFTSL